ncbi:MAG: type II toxin-antitoxin system PemK/MazF family toxin [Erysipelotrichales bacterium]|nr:type II toxin-antitoxin system PemK/MazF family toxin [Erysipelotrichales bacterium]
MIVHRGEIYYANLSPYIGCEQGGVRPVVVIQNEIGNRYSHTVIIAPISTKLTKHPIPTHVVLPDNVLEKQSMVLLEQIRTIDKSRIIKYVSSLESDVMSVIDQALKISLGI